MKKLLTTAFVFVMFLFSAQSVLAYTFPSTNQLNKDKLVPGRVGQIAPYVELVEAGTNYVKLRFVNAYTGLHYFEYKVDGVLQTSGTPHEFLTPAQGYPNEFEYPGVCVSTNGPCPTGPTEKTINATSKVEVRLALGGENDWYFDWTRFDVLFTRTASITSPEANSVVSGVISLDAILNDKDKNDSVSWAVRKGTCAANTNTVFGNVDGFHDTYDWNYTNFHASADTTLWKDGEYCFVFNPSESKGDTAIRETKEFTVNNTPDNKDQCKKDGWKLFFTPKFKNQGDCVSYTQSNEHAVANKEK